MAKNLSTISKCDIFASFAHDEKTKKMKSYKNKNCYKPVISYVIDINNNKNVRYYGASGADYTDIDNIVKQFKVVYKLFKSPHAKRRLYHFYMSFNDPEFDHNIAQIIGTEISEHIFNMGHQCIYGVHEDTDHVHIHFVFNAMNFCTGNLFHANKKELNTFLDDMKVIAVDIHNSFL